MEDQRGRAGARLAFLLVAGVVAVLHVCAAYASVKVGLVTWNLSTFDVPFPNDGGYRAAFFGLASVPLPLWLLFGKDIFNYWLIAPNGIIVGLVCAWIYGRVAARGRAKGRGAAFWGPALLLTALFYTLSSLVLGEILDLPWHIHRFCWVIDRVPFPLNIVTTPIARGYEMGWGIWLHLVYVAMWGFGIMAAYHALCAAGRRLRGKQPASYPATPG